MNNVLELKAVAKFVDTCNQSWLKGWNERNGGNMSYRMKDEEVDAIKHLLTDKSDWKSIGITVENLANEYFTVTALDNAGNLSDEYMIQNPYFGQEENYAGELPADASPSGETEAKADVTEYTEVNGDDGSVKVFYTFETENGKVFYLIINRTQNVEEVHFLTDVSENDLLNTTSDNSEVLPKNSAALSSGIPVTQEPKIEEQPNRRKRPQRK